MYSREHLASSLLVGLALVPVVETPLGAPGTVVYAGLLGTFVDLDHFVIARLRTGSWSALRRALTSPRAALLEQDHLFERGDVGKRTRLASHLAIGTVLVGGLLPTWPSLAVVSAVVLGLHVAADAVWDATRAAEQSRAAGGRDSDAR